jgi:translocation and assembly module TamB
MRWVKRALIVTLALAVLAALGAGSLLWVIGSESGTRWLVARLLAATPELTIARQRGSLREGLVLEGIAWRSARDELDIDSLALDWDAAAAIAGTLAFDRAAASRASYRRLPATTDADSSSPPELPWPLRIDDASVAALEITIAGRTLAFDTVRFAGTLADNRLALADVAARSGTAELAARATVALRPVELVTTVEWSAPVGSVAARGTATLEGSWPTLRVHHELAAPFPAVTDGTLVFGAAAPTAELRTTWRDLAWPGIATVASPSGELTLAGSVDAYRYDADGAVVVAGRNASFTAGGTGARLELAIERVELAADADRGALRATGTASLAARETRLTVTAEDFDAAWVDARWPGRLRGTASLHAALAPVVRAEVGDLALAGELRGYPITIGGGATFTAPGNVSLAALRLESTGNRTVLTGTFDADNVDLRVDAELTNLDLLVPGARGAVNASGTLGGTWRDPYARGRIAARDVALASFTLTELDANGEAGLASTAPLALTIEAAGVARGPVTVERIQATVTGTTAMHAATVAAAAADWDATLEASGGAVARGGGEWRGVITSLEIDEHVLGPWRLEEPTAVTLAPRAATLANACLLHASRARWCAELDVQGRSADRIAVAGQNFYLATFAPLLPPGIELDGVYQLSASLFDVLGDPRGALAVTGETTRAHIALEGAEAFDMELDEARLGLTLTSGRLELQAHIASTNGGDADLRAAIADVRADDSAIAGTLRVQWPDLRSLTLLSPDLEEVAGTLAIDLGVAGTVAEPRVNGQAAVHDGRLGVPRWGLVVTDVDATATSGDGSSLQWNATGRAGDGTLTLNGTTTLAAAAGWPTRFTLRGDDVPLVQLPEAQVFANPNLDIDVALPRVTVAGSVHVPRAAIEVETLPAQAVAPSPDAVVHGAAATQRAEPLRVSAAIDFTLGDDVRYAGLGLDTTVAGELRLTTEPGRTATASGTLSLAGTYNAYGQNLELERGRLLFSGPLDNPGLDVRAVRTIDTTRVGVELTGTVHSPRTRVVATPAMSEVDALSYLLFGRPASGTDADTGADETSTLQAAALSLGLQQALPAVQRLGTSLGLDELSVQGTAADAGELMAGKYLSPRVYIRYSYGLFNRIGGLLLRFRVNERLSIETRSGEQKSMDLLYTVEKD